MRYPLMLALPLLLAGSVDAKEVDWNLDSYHSTVGFSVRHLGISKVRGKFNTYEGKIKADDKTAKLTSVEATVDANSIDTGIAKRDQHLQADDFFAASKYPKLKLKTRSIKWKGNKFTAVVDLTIRNITKTVSAKGELLGKQKVNMGRGEEIRAGYLVTTAINRKDFGLSFSGTTEGVAMVGDQVTIELEIEMVRSVAQTKS